MAVESTWSRSSLSDSATGDHPAKIGGVSGQGSSSTRALAVRSRINPFVSCGPRSGRREGAVLIEFALVSLILYILLATLIEFGRAGYLIQELQQVSRIAARELALEPLPASLTFEQALSTPQVVERIYDPTLLVIDVDAQVPDIDGDGARTAVDVDAFFGELPVINRALRGLMQREQVEVPGMGSLDLIRYPGALLQDPAPLPGRSGLRVGIPEIVARSGTGTETIVWRRVVEEVRVSPSEPPADPAQSPFSALSTEGGLVALRIHYPYQAAALASFRDGADGPFSPNLQNPNLADDGGVQVLAGSTAEGELIGGVQPDGPYGGSFGLGRLFLFGEEVRPYRRLLTAQCLYRRELPLGS